MARDMSEHDSNAADGPGSDRPWMKLYTCMARSRLIEERLIRLYHQGRIYGGVYTGIGHEAIGAATALAAGPDDLFAPCIRDLTVHLARGETTLNVFRHWLGRRDGPMRGRDCNVHFGNLDHGVLAMISHLGAMLPVLTGAVMARRRKGLDTVGLAYIGDGATSTGDFHEAVNFASVMDAPVLFVIENNKFAYSTPNERQFRCRRLADRAAGYGMEGRVVDGNDAWSLFEQARGLLAQARSTRRPFLLECDTCRVRGHGEHDDFSYAPPELLAEYKKRDPLEALRARVRDMDPGADAELARIDRACKDEVDRACHQALGEPGPEPASLLKGVYADD